MCHYLVQWLCVGSYFKDSLTDHCFSLQITRVIFCVFLETDFAIYKKKMAVIFQGMFMSWNLNQAPITLLLFMLLLLMMPLFALTWTHFFIYYRSTFLKPVTPDVSITAHFYEAWQFCVPIFILFWHPGSISMWICQARVTTSNVNT